MERVVCRRRRWCAVRVALAVFCAVCLAPLALAAFPVGCGGSCPAELDGYRDGRCAACDCCPRCWTCVELMHYGCAEKLGVTERREAAELGTFVPGQRIDWSTSAMIGFGSNSSSSSSSSSSSGWHQCAAVPALPAGLSFGDNGKLSGVLQFDPTRAEQYAVAFTAFHTRGFGFGVGGGGGVGVGGGGDSGVIGGGGTAAQGELTRVELRFDVVGNLAPPLFDAVAEADADADAEAAAHAAASAAFGAYRAFDEQRLPHSEATRRMRVELKRLQAVLERRPRAGGGRYWGWLGALHMNVHKLLENMLAECEVFLGFALRFPEAAAGIGGGGAREESAAQIARENLGGCYAKRQLEAAKFLWVTQLEAAQREEVDWAAVEAVLLRAAAMKEGWGWGVNNGDIWMLLGAAQAVRGRLDEADATLALAHERSPSHPWTQANQRAVRELRAIGTAAADEESRRARRAALVTETRSWCSQVLPAVRPNKRPGPLPLLPRLGVPRQPTCVAHPRDTLYAALHVPMGVPPSCGV